MGAWALLTMGVNATLLIKNGHVHDGTGAPAFHGDIAIDGETIVAVGDPGTLNVSGEPRVIDAEGMLVWCLVPLNLLPMLLAHAPAMRDLGLAGAVGGGLHLVLARLQRQEGLKYI